MVLYSWDSYRRSVHCRIPLPSDNDGIGQDGLRRGIKVLLGELSLHGLNAQNHQSIAIFGTSVQLQSGQLITRN